MLDQYGPNLQTWLEQFQAIESFPGFFLIQNCGLVRRPDDSRISREHPQFFSHGGYFHALPHSAASSSPKWGAGGGLGVLGWRGIVSFEKFGLNVQCHLWMSRLSDPIEIFLGVPSSKLCELRYRYARSKCQGPIPRR